MGSTSPLSCARRTKNEPCPVLENDVKKGRWPCEVSAGSDLFQTVKPDQNQTRGGPVKLSLLITPIKQGCRCGGIGRHRGLKIPFICSTLFNIVLFFWVNPFHPLPAFRYKSGTKSGTTGGGGWPTDSCGQNVDALTRTDCFRNRPNSIYTRAGEA